MGAAARPRWLWIVLLAGPVVGYTCFWVVYLAAEAGCAEGLDLPGGTALRVVLLATSAVSLMAVLGFARRAWRLWRTDGEPSPELDDNRRFVGFTGLLLGGLFTAFVLALAGPVVGSTLC